MVRVLSRSGQARSSQVKTGHGYKKKSLKTLHDVEKVTKRRDRKHEGKREKRGRDER